VSVEFEVKVIPRSSQEKIARLADGTLKIWVHAAATDGQANEAVTAILAKELGVPKSNIEIIRGEAARAKKIRVNGIEPSEALKRLS
jgi:uncharacterized protein (TIGR00251 family)